MHFLLLGHTLVLSKKGWYSRPWRFGEVGRNKFDPHGCSDSSMRSEFNSPLSVDLAQTDRFLPFSPPILSNRCSNSRLPTLGSSESVHSTRLRSCDLCHESRTLNFNFNFIRLPSFLLFSSCTCGRGNVVLTAVPQIKRHSDECFRTRGAILSSGGPLDHPSFRSSWWRWNSDAVWNVSDCICNSSCFPSGAM